MTETQNSKTSINGRWTKEQHQKFLLGLQLFGKNWKKIQGLIGTRTGSQIRSHAQKFFLKVQKEDEIDAIDQKDSIDEHSALSHACSQNEKSTEMSYFFQQILKQSKGQSNFDFWSQLIDHGRDNSSITENCFAKRKGSFIVCGQQQNSDDQQSNSGGKPRKIVKV